MNDRAIRPAKHGALGLGAMAGNIPPDAVVKAVETIGTIVLGGFQMVAERQRFEQDLKRLQHKDMTAQQNLLMLIQLADQANLTDEARNHLVTAICELALK